MKKWMTILGLMLPGIAFAQPYSLNWFKVAGGGGTSANGVYTMSDTFGQQDATGPMQGGGYSVSGGFWSLFAQTSSPNAPPDIITQPQSQLVLVDSAISLSVPVSGTPPFFIQWQLNGTNLSDGGGVSGSLTTDLTLSKTWTNNIGSYTVIIENAYGSVTSSVIKLTLVLPEYSVADLGSLPGRLGAVLAFGINNYGEVVGTESGYAFLYSDGVMEELGDGTAYCINDFGQIVADGEFEGVLFYNGTIQFLNGLDHPFGINDSGQIVGAINDGDNFHAALYANGTLIDLGTLGGDSSEARGINNRGQVVGDASTADGPEHAFLYNCGAMYDLATLGRGETSSVALSINDSGQVVGQSQTVNGGGYHAFSYSNGTMTDLGTLGGNNSSALGINGGGEVVGYSELTNTSRTDAFCFINGEMLDLNDLIVSNNLGTYLDEATGINDSGQIIANGANYHAYLLTPIPLMIQSALASNGNFTLSWNTLNTLPPVAYQVQYTPSLSQTNWINLGGLIIKTGATASATDTITNSQRFYRVVLAQ